MTTVAPIRVAVVDLDRPIAPLDCRRGGGEAYRAAWVLATRNGVPLGSTELTVAGGLVPAAELEHALRASLGAAWADPARVRVPAVDLPPASVVVPTALSRPEQLARLVDSLRALDYPDYELIVVDNRPAGADAVTLPGVRVVRETRPGISAARNRGLAEARGEIIAFTDDDVTVDPGWLRALATRFAADPELAAVTGLVVPAELETEAQVLFEQSGSGLDRGYRPLEFRGTARFGLERRDLVTGERTRQSLYAMGELGLGSNMAFRASVLRARGAFDVSLGVGTPTHGGEDLAMLVELLHAGHALVYEPAAVVHHSHRATMADLERQIHGYGVGFTAMLTAIVLRRPSHLLGLALVLPAWMRSLRDPGAGKTAARSEDYPDGLSRAELRGMLAGPLAYLRARRGNRRWGR